MGAHIHITEPGPEVRPELPRGQGVGATGPGSATPRSSTPRSSTPRYPPNHRPQPADHVRYGVPAHQLVAMIKAEAAFDAGVAEAAWKLEPPTSTPVLLVQIDRDVAIAGIGAWSRHRDAEQAAKRVPRIKSEVPAEAASELNGVQTYTGSPPEIASGDGLGKTSSKSLGDRPQNPTRRGRPAKVRIVRPEILRGKRRRVTV
jgi:hypothetical protein